MQGLERRMWLVTAVLGLVLGGRLAQDSLVLGIVVAAALLALAWRMTPWYGGRTVRHDDLGSLPADQRRVVVYWRPGCAYCARLRRALGAQRARATWVNIWQDDAAARFVRSVNDGNETVPTVVVDGVAMTNPDPRLVREQLR